MPPGAGSRVSQVLNRLDWALGEAGRREHRFGWLRDDSTGEWIALAAYYPSSHVVVAAGDDPAQMARCRAEVPAHGFFLVVLDDLELDRDPAVLAADLRRRLVEQGWQPAGANRPVATPAPAVSAPVVRAPAVPAPVVRAPAVPAPVVRAPAVRAPAVPAPVAAGLVAVEPEPEPDDIELTFGPMPALVSPTRAGRPRPAPVGARAGDPAAGVTLVVVAALELLIGGVAIGLGAGDPILGFGFVLDACARVLGTVAASQAGDTDAAWSAVLFGSPALWGLDAAQDVARAAQLTALVAGAVLALGLAVAVL